MDWSFLLNIAEFIGIIGGTIGALSSIYIWYKNKERDKKEKELEELGEYRKDLREDKDDLEKKIDSLKGRVNSLDDKYTELKAQAMYTISYVQIIQNRFDLLRATIEHENGHSDRTVEILNNIEEDLKGLEKKIAAGVELPSQSEMDKVRNGIEKERESS